MPSAVVSLANMKYRPPLCGGGLPTTKVRISRSFMSAYARRRDRTHKQRAAPPAGARRGDRRRHIAEGERAPYPMAVCAGSDPADHPAVVPDGLIADCIGVSSIDGKRDQAQFAATRPLGQRRGPADEVTLLQSDEAAETRLVGTIDRPELPRPVAEALLDAHGVERAPAEGLQALPGACLDQELVE